MRFANCELELAVIAVCEDIVSDNIIIRRSVKYEAWVLGSINHIVFYQDVAAAII